tara:strand:+ start:581 stop:1261 length:681 start_codon:yes stop_codon:yes gene_type:complete
MVKVGVVYSIVRDLCNKDQKGFVTPSVFNTLAEAAQMNVYNEMFNELKLATRLRRSGSDAGRDKSAYKMVEEDLSYFIQTSLLTEIDGVAARKPDNLSRIISMHTEDAGVSVEIIYDAEKLRRVLNSNLSAPTEEFPVALVGSNTIDVFPDGVEAEVTYYRYPVAPLYSVTQISDGFAIEDITNSIDFELPDHYLTELVGEIARMIGVRLRDDVLMQYGVAETTNR